MTTDRRLPTDALEFIRRCVRERKVHWTYHVNLRLAGRYISRDDCFHVLFAVDVENDNVRIVTAYRPHPDEWDSEFRLRKEQR